MERCSAYMQVLKKKVKNVVKSSNPPMQIIQSKHSKAPLKIMVVHKTGKVSSGEKYLQKILLICIGKNLMLLSKSLKE